MLVFLGFVIDNLLSFIAAVAAAISGVAAMDRMIRKRGQGDSNKKRMIWLILSVVVLVAFIPYLAYQYECYQKNISENSTDDAVGNTKNEIVTSDYGELSIQFCETAIMFSDGIDVFFSYGPPISTYNVEDIYLVSDEYEVQYTDYSIEDGIFIFTDIPRDIELTLHVTLDGYKEAVFYNIKRTAASEIDPSFFYKFCLEKEDTEYSLATSFSIVDKDGNLLDVECLYFIFPWEPDMRYGDYYTVEGDFPYLTLIDQDYTVDLCIENPLGDGVDYFCSIPLTCFEKEASADDVVIILSEDGTCEIIPETGIDDSPALQ